MSRCHNYRIDHGRVGGLVKTFDPLLHSIQVNASPAVS